MIDKVLNLDEALGRFGGNVAIYKKMLTMFKDSSYFDDLNTSLKENELEQAERAAHTIKGTAGNLSLTALYQVACDLDEQLKKGEDFAENHQKLQEIYALTMTEITDFIER